MTGRAEMSWLNLALLLLYDDDHFVTRRIGPDARDHDRAKNSYRLKLLFSLKFSAT